MGKAISLFNDFKKGENTTTNYCGLMLKLIYNEVPTAFQNIIADLIADSRWSFDILPEFNQQETKRLAEKLAKEQGNKQTSKKSIPDLCLRQNSFVIYFENKLTDWHYDDQILRHLDGLIGEKGADVKILFLLSNEYDSDIDERIARGAERAEKYGILLKRITYQDLLDAIKHAVDEFKTSEYLKTFVNEFEEYLSNHDLLPLWRNRLDIVCCGGTSEEVEDDKYICPESGGAYSHKRSKYFGAYWERNVNYIAEIAGVVTVREDEFGERIYRMKYKNDASLSDEKLIEMAQERFSRCKEWRFKEVQGKELQIFVLENRKSLNYQKRTKGGLRAKTYHFVKSDSIEAVCKELDGQTWE